MHSTGELLTSGAELELTPYTDQQTVQPLMGKIKQLVNDFDSRLSKRKKKLDDSVRLHRLTAAVSDCGWLIVQVALTMACFWLVTTRLGSWSCKTVALP